MMHRHGKGEKQTSDMRFSNVDDGHEEWRISAGRNITQMKK